MARAGRGSSRGYRETVRQRHLLHPPHQGDRGADTPRHRGLHPRREREPGRGAQMGALRTDQHRCGGYRQRLPDQAGQRHPAPGPEEFSGDAAQPGHEVQGHSVHGPHARHPCRRHELRPEVDAVVLGDEARHRALRAGRARRRGGQDQRRRRQLRQHPPVRAAVRLRASGHRVRRRLHAGDPA